MSKKSVLMVSEYPPTKGAVSDYTYHLVEELSEEIEIDILSTSGEKPPEEQQIDSVEVIGEIPHNRKDWNEIRLENYDLLHFQFYVERLKHFFNYKIRGGSTPQTLITLHDVPKSLTDKRYFAFFRNVVLLTEETEKQFKSNHPVMSRVVTKNIFPAPYLGIDKNLKQRVLDKNIETELDPEKTNLVLPGFIHEKKGFDKVVEIMPELLEEIEDLHLTFAGGLHRTNSSEYLDQIKKRIEELEIEDNVTITGLLPTEDHVNQYIIEADVVAMPFTEISQSATLTKTLALGTVPVVTPLDTLKPAIDNYGGIMIEKDNQKELKKGIINSLRNPPKINSQKIREELSWENNAEKHKEIYSQVI